MAMEVELIAAGTKLSAKGEGASHDISASQTRTFLCAMDITDQIEQESIDLSVWGSEDGQNWGTKPLLMMPQRFYRGETRQILDLSLKPEIRFIRAKWDLFRWGRVAPHPMFVVGFHASEVPAFAQKTAAEPAARG
ncbi:MAG TPA: hypothetical protein VMH00_05320 [Candidatus Limnocylindrales bacterium]|nr:hypothetical protein [Candidatus Limnocylindrales bacterium]